MTKPPSPAGLSEAQKREVFCPHFEDHTLSPEGYIQWHAWAEKMSETHRQEKCGGCGLYTIWTPKQPRRVLNPEIDHD